MRTRPVVFALIYLRICLLISTYWRDTSSSTLLFIYFAVLRITDIVNEIVNSAEVDAVHTRRVRTNEIAISSLKSHGHVINSGSVTILFSSNLCICCDTRDIDQDR